MITQNNKIFKWFDKRYHLVVYHGNSYREIHKFRFSRFLLIFILSGIFLIFFTILSLIVVYTPVKQFIPGYPDKGMRQQIYDISIQVDSLTKELELRDQYLNAIKDFVFNKVPIDQDFVLPSTELSKEDIKDFNNPTMPRKIIKEKLSNINYDLIPTLFPPIQGTIISDYNPSINHFGIDIVSSSNDVICSCYSGIVIFSDYVVSTGYTIIIQHKFNLLSVYKHVQSSYVKSGDIVDTGQAIARYGNSGEDSSGLHLHFELWRKCVSVNPQKHIDFQ